MALGLLTGAACRTRVGAPGPPAPAVIAQTRLGPVTVEDLERELSADGHSPADPATRRRALDDLVFEMGLAEEARSLGLDRGPALAQALQERREETLLGAVADRYVRDRVTVTPGAVDESLRARAAEFADVERIQLKHIFRRLPSRASAEERATALQGMQDLLGQIRAGASFDELARTRSDSESAKFDGRMAAVSRGQLDPVVDAVVWALEPGQVSDVVATPLGYHIFKLERRIPPRPLTPEEARKTVERSLRLEAEAAARKALFQELLTASGATYNPSGLGSASAGATLFVLDGRAVSALDLEARRDALPPKEQRSKSLPDLLEEVASRELRLWKAGADRLADDPALAFTLAREERKVLAQAAFERRLDVRGKGLGEPELRAVYDANPSRFQTPERHRLSVIVERFGPDHSPHYYYENLDRLQREIRSGSRSFAEVARTTSDDPSAVRGGDLGFLLLRDFGLWFGLTAYHKATSLVPGELAGPLPFEVYNEAALLHEPRGYMLIRLDEKQPASPRTFEEARNDVVADWLQAHAIQVSAEIRAEVLASMHPSIDEAVLSGWAP